MPDAYDDQNVFARILRGEVPAERVYEDDEFLAFRDAAPAAPTHILVIPKRAQRSGPAALTDADAEWVGRMVVLGTRLAADAGVDASGYRLVMNSGGDAGQTVHHLHMHVIGGARLGPVA